MYLENLGVRNQGRTGLRSAWKVPLRHSHQLPTPSSQVKQQRLIHFLHLNPAITRAKTNHSDTPGSNHFGQLNSCKIHCHTTYSPSHLYGSLRSVLSLRGFDRSLSLFLRQPTPSTSRIYRMTSEPSVFTTSPAAAPDPKAARRFARRTPFAHVSSAHR